AAERPERVIGVVTVVVRQRLPVGGEVLGKTPIVFLGHPVDEAFGHRQRSVGPTVVFGGIGGREEGFDAVHVAVGAAIVLGPGPVRVPALQHRPGRFLPEVFLHDAQRLGQQVTGAGATRDGGGGGGQNHEGVGV